MEFAELGSNEDLAQIAIKCLKIWINQGDLEICILESRGEHIMKLLNYRPLFSKIGWPKRGNWEQRERGKWEAANINGFKEGIWDVKKKLSWPR